MKNKIKKTEGEWILNLNFFFPKSKWTKLVVSGFKTKRDAKLFADGLLRDF